MTVESPASPSAVAPLPAGLYPAAAALSAGAARAARPQRPVSVAAWAAEHRFVAAESGSPFPGKWDPANSPLTVEIAEAVSFTDPCREVVVKKSAQVGVSEVGINLFGSIAHRNPCPMMIVLPTTEEVTKYNKLKLDPTIRATPVLRDTVAETKSRDADSSTAAMKRFRGGFCVVTGANSSVGLQMISARVIVFEEVSGYPHDAGRRGDPVEQVLSRSKAWLSAGRRRGAKHLYISAPDLKGTCRISAKFEASDQRRPYVPCPHCGAFQRLEFDRLKWDSDRPPHNAYFVCASGNGCVIEGHRRRVLIARAVWVRCYDGGPDNPAPPVCFPAEDLQRWRGRGAEGRQPGFAMWQAHSMTVSWDDTVAEYLTARANPLKLKAFTQQALGEPWEESGEAPDYELLYQATRALALQPYRVPPGGLFLTGAADVQADRIEWAVYAWGLGFTAWCIDAGVIEGNPALPITWRPLDAVIAKRYEDWNGVARGIDAFGIDSGFLSQKVYAFAARYAGTGRVYALDGRDGWRHPAIGSPTKKDVDQDGRRIGGILLWPVGTWDLKSEHYGALKLFLDGPAGDDGRFAPGAAFYGEHCDREYFRQLTAEYLDQVDTRSGVARKVWTKASDRRNEALDIAVYARALAHRLADALSPAEWAALAARVAAPPEQVQRDMAALWAPRLGEAAPAREAPAGDAPPAPAADDAPAPASAADWLGGRGGDWFAWRA